MSDVWKTIMESDLPIVLYGAGGQGQRVATYLLKNGVRPKFFCVTKITDEQFVLGIEVKEFREIKERYSKCIYLLTVMPLLANEIMKTIGDDNVNIYINMVMPFKIGNKFLDINEIDKKKTLKMLHTFFFDKKSRQLIKSFLEFKTDGNGIPLIKHIDGVSFFDDPLLKVNRGYTYVDCGAYTGDTIIDFLQFNGFYYKQIIGIEMEEGNFKDLQSLVDFAKISNIDIINTALAEEVKKTEYYTSSFYHFFNANLYNSINEVSSLKEKNDLLKKNGDQIVVPIETDTLDNILGARNVTSPCIIKLNAMGAELDIVRGGKRTLRELQPVLVMEYGTKLEHLSIILHEIKASNASYTFYLRQKNVFGDSKTVLYCI